MVDRTKPTPVPVGILRPDELARHTRLERVAPSSALVPWVAHHWCLRWELPAGTRFTSQTLPHPAGNLSVELGHAREGVGEDRVVLTGVVTKRFDVTLAARGWVLGVRFRPGGLAAMTGLDAATLTDATVPASALLPSDVVEALRALTIDDEPLAAARLAEAALTPLLPAEPDPVYELVLGLVDDMRGDPGLVRVSQLEERHALSTRHLERLFLRYVGVGAKWVLARYRMHDAVGALDAGYTGTLGDLAATYGWYDQSHFTRDFVRLVGTTPGAYRRAHR